MVSDGELSPVRPCVRLSHLDSVEQMHPVDGDDLVVLLLRLLRGTADRLKVEPTSEPCAWDSSYSELVLQLFDLRLQALQLLALLLPLGRRSSGVGELRQAVQGVLQLPHLPGKIVNLQDKKVWINARSSTFLDVAMVTAFTLLFFSLSEATWFSTSCFS